MSLEFCNGKEKFYMRKNLGNLTFVSAYLANRSLEKCEDVRLFRKAGRETGRQSVKEDVFLPLQKQAGALLS